MNKQYFSLLILLLTVNSGLNAKRYYTPNDNWSFLDEIKQFEKDMKKGLKNFKSSTFSNFNSGFGQENKEDKKLLQEAQNEFSKFKPEITKDQTGNIIITFNIENVDKNGISLTLQDGTLKGLIPTKYGKIELDITSQYLQTVSNVEIKRESKSEEKQSQNYSYHSQSYSNKEKLPTNVDLSTVKSETKDNKFIISFSPKEYPKIDIKHS